MHLDVCKCGEEYELFKVSATMLSNNCTHEKKSPKYLINAQLRIKLSDPCYALYTRRETGLLINFMNEKKRHAP